MGVNMNYNDLNNSRLSLSSIYAGHLSELTRIESLIIDKLTWKQYTSLIHIRKGSRIAATSQRDMLKVTKSSTILKAHQDAAYVLSQAQDTYMELVAVLTELERYNDQAA
jgi:hypothetical protein